MDWNDLRFFLAVANSRSLSAASRQLGVSTSTVSRRILILEEALGVKPFRHHSDGYEVTEAGRVLIAPAEQAELQLRAFERAARDTNDPLSGIVRIEAPELLSQQIFIPGFASFIKKYPGIQVDLRSNVHPAQLATQRSDIVIRIVPPERGSYKMRSVGKVVFGLYASDTYIAANGNPTREQELESHRIIAWTEEQSYLRLYEWLEEVTAGCPPAMRFSSFRTQLHAVESGLGIGVLPFFAARRSGLTRVLEDVPPLTLDVWLLVQDQAAKSRKVQIVKEHLVSTLNLHADEMTAKTVGV